MDFNSTVKGSVLEGFYPEGWDFEKIAFILPVGPMGMYKWVVYFPKELAGPLEVECN